MEVGSREKEKEVPLQHTECEGDLRLVSSSRLSQFSNAGPGSLSSRIILKVTVLSEEETFLVSGSFILCLCIGSVCVCTCFFIQQ